MELVFFEDYKNSYNKEPLSVCIGQFDGVHLAHQELIKTCSKIGRENGYKTAVMTFEPHPLSILKPNSSFQIMSLLDKKYIISEFDIDYLIVIKFDLNFASTLPIDFVKQYLCDINVKEVTVGFDFSYGMMGKGKPENIKSYSDNTINTTIISEIKKDNEKISSTLIRKYLDDGEIEKINELLNRPFGFSGKVIRGNGIGRKINLPTANIEPFDESLKMRYGVYACRVIVDEKKYIGMMNVGHNPTFNYKDRLSFEVNIFDFDEVIYDKEVYVECFKHTRDEEKYASMDVFLHQIEHDKEEVRKFFECLK